MLGIDEGRNATILLSIGDGVQGQGRLSGGLRSIHLDHSRTRQATDPQCFVEGK